jgi:hypothetical protein
VAEENERSAVEALLPRGDLLLCGCQHCLTVPCLINERKGPYGRSGSCIC